MYTYVWLRSQYAWITRLDINRVIFYYFVFTLVRALLPHYVFSENEKFESTFTNDLVISLDDVFV